MRLSSAVTEVAKVFGTQFELSGLSFDECLLLLLVCSMIGWVAAGDSATFTSLYSGLKNFWYTPSLQCRIPLPGRIRIHLTFLRCGFSSGCHNLCVIYSQPYRELVDKITV